MTYMTKEEIIERWVDGEYNTPNGKALLDIDLNDFTTTAYNEGKEEGKEDGYDEGYNEGKEDGYDEGYNEGIGVEV